MDTRHMLARLLGGCAMLAAGCFGSHRTGPEPRPTPSADAGLAPPSAPDASPAPLPPPGSTCGSNFRLGVTFETLGRRPCEPGVYEGSALYGVETAPRALRLLIDTCPDADDDCRCSVTVSGLDEGFGAEIARPTGAVTVHFAESGVLIEEPASGCPMDDYGCVRPLVFAAMDGSLDAPPIDPDALDVSFGEAVCEGDAPERGPGCSATGFALRLIAWSSGFPGAIGTEYAALEGDTIYTPETGTTFRAIRTNVRSCPDELVAPTAAWAAWATRRAG